MAAEGEETNASRLAAQARKAAKDAFVEYEFEESFNDLVEQGKFSSEVAAAFEFVQTKLDGFLVLMGFAFTWSHSIFSTLRKDAKGIACPLRAAADVKGVNAPMVIGGSLGFLKLNNWSCVAVNIKRIKLAVLSWSRKPIELNRPTLRAQPCQTHQLFLLNLGVVGTIEVNSDPGLWLSTDFKDLQRSSSDSESLT